VPLRRFGSKDELAIWRCSLCSDAASYITGGIYLCDGGMSLSQVEFVAGDAVAAVRGADSRNAEMTLGTAGLTARATRVSPCGE